MTGEIFAAVEGGRPSGTALAVDTGRRRWTYDELLSAATLLAEELAQPEHAEAPVVAAVTDPASTALLTLAGDLAGRVVVHADPQDPRVPAGVVVRDATGGQKDARPGRFRERLGLTCETRQGWAPLGDLPPGSQLFGTSGSTGEPLTVVRSPAAVLADARRVARYLTYSPATPVAVLAPVRHVYGHAYGLVGPLLSGAAVHARGAASVPSRLARVTRASAARVLIGHPAFFRLLAAAAPRDPALDLGPLARAVSAGAPLVEGVAQTLLQRHSFDLLNCYGSSEAGAVTLTPLTGREEPGDAGIPLPGVRVEVAPAVEGVGGELLVSTDSLATGYLRGTAFSPLPRSGPWYRTGDIGTVQRGRVQILGRIGKLINVAGRKVAPWQVEQVLNRHPAIAESQVVAEPDGTRGEVPVAVVVLRQEVSTAEIVAWCRRELASHEVPRRLDVRAELPRSATGKLLRPAVQSADPRPTEGTQ